MGAMMGFAGFGTTKQKKVQGNNVGAVAKNKVTEYRQYMYAPSIPVANELDVILTFGGGGAIGIVRADSIGPYHRLDWDMRLGCCHFA